MSGAYTCSFGERMKEFKRKRPVSGRKSIDGYFWFRCRAKRRSGNGPWHYFPFPASVTLRLTGEVQKGARQLAGKVMTGSNFEFEALLQAPTGVLRVATIDGVEIYRESLAEVPR